MDIVVGKSIYKYIPLWKKLAFGFSGVMMDLLTAGVFLIAAKHNVGNWATVFIVAANGTITFGLAAFFQFYGGEMDTMLGEIFGKNGIIQDCKENIFTKEKRLKLLRVGVKGWGKLLISVIMMLLSVVPYVCLVIFLFKTIMLLVL